jgi:hypothetical protein
MAYGLLDDKMHSHWKIMRAGNAAIGAWARMISWSSDHESDGRVPESVALHFAGDQATLDRLLVANLLDAREDGSPEFFRGEPFYPIHGFLDVNPSAAEVRE